MTAEEFIRFGSPEYWALLACVAFARGMDFLSTWVATPNLRLEANPIARMLGWKLGMAVNAVMCAVFAAWPLPCIVISTASLLVAARNFQNAWLMRTLGEDGYRAWISERISEAKFSLFLFCLVAQAGLTGLVGAGLMYYSQLRLVPFGVGMGIVTYASAILAFSLLSVWRAKIRPL